MSAGRIAWLGPDDPADSFPDVDNALREPDGLLAAGGDLSSQRLIAAYSRGIFPWYSDGQPILWWSPDPRCVLYPAELHVSRRLRQQVRAANATLEFNRDFGSVIRACARRRRSQQGTWITADIVQAFESMHAEGWAHSIEIRENGKLVGGLYGLSIGRVFFGESMFSAAPNASKMAMIGLTRHMRQHDLEILDCQIVSPHLLTMGARTIPRHDFTAILRSACVPPVPHDAWPGKPLPVKDLL